MTTNYFKNWAVLTALSFSATWAFSQEKYEFKGKIGKTLAESVEDRPVNVQASEGAPNMVWILLDDVGFGATATFERH